MDIAIKALEEIQVRRIWQVQYYIIKVVMTTWSSHHIPCETKNVAYWLTTVKCQYHSTCDQERGLEVSFHCWCTRTYQISGGDSSLLFGTDVQQGCEKGSQIVLLLWEIIGKFDLGWVKKHRKNVIIFQKAFFLPKVTIIISRTTFDKNKPIKIYTERWHLADIFQPE